MKHLLTTALLALAVLAPLSAAAQTVQELRIRWDSATGATTRRVEGAPAPEASFRAVQRSRRAGTVTRRRGTDLSSNHVVVIATNAQGEELHRDVIPDPRLLRAEGPGPSGELTGEVLYRASTEFLVSFPDDPAITEIRLYHPRWTGRVFELDQLVAIRLP